MPAKTLDEEVEGKKEHAEEEQESAPGEAAAWKLYYGLNEAGGYDDQARFAAAFVEWAGRNIAREISAEYRNFIFEPIGKFLPVTPAIDGAGEEDQIAQAGQKPQGCARTPIKHATSTGREGEFTRLREW